MAECSYRIKNVSPCNQGIVKAFVDVIINDVWVVCGFRVLESTKDKGQLWVGKPCKQSGARGKWFDAAYPLVQDEMKKVEAQILEAYTDYIGGNNV